MKLENNKNKNSERAMPSHLMSKTKIFLVKFIYYLYAIFTLEGTSNGTCGEKNEGRFKFSVSVWACKKREMRNTAIIRRERDARTGPRWN